MKLKSSEVAAYFNKHAESFDGIYSGEKHFLFRCWDRLTRQNIAQRLEYTLSEFDPIHNKSVLDIGCGPGRYCFIYAELGANKIRGVDISKQMIAVAKSKCNLNPIYSKCEFEVSNIMDVVGKHDYISAMGFFDYINEPEMVLKHIRTMTPEKFVCSFPARMSFRYPFRKLWFKLHNTPVLFYSQKEIIQLLESANFEIHNIKKQGPIYLVSTATLHEND